MMVLIRLRGCAGCHMSLLFTDRVRNHDHKLYFSFQFDNTTSYVSLTEYVLRNQLSVTTFPAK